MTKRSLLLFCIISLSSLYSCVEKRDLKKNNVVVQISSSPSGLHPTNGNSSLKSFIHNYLHISLLSIDIESEELTNVLLENLPEPDTSGLVYKCKISSKAAWDDKTKLTAEDVIFSVKTLLCPLTNNAEIRPIYSGIISEVYVDENDPKTFFLKCKKKHILNGEILADIVLLQRSVWDPKNLLKNLSFEDLHSDNFSTSKEIEDWFVNFNNSDNAYLPEKVIGNGPYKLESFEKDNFISLVKKDNWWGSNEQSYFFEQKPDKIIFKVIKDRAATYLAIKNEEIDFTHSAGGTSKLLKLQKLEYFNKNYKSDFVPGYSYSYMGLNMRPDEATRTPFFKDRKVRKAVALSTPVEELIELLSYGKAQRQASIVSPLKKSCDSTLAFVPYDLDSAKKLLAEAGWKDSDGDHYLDKDINGVNQKFSFKLNYISSPTSKEIALILKESYKQIGIDLQSNPLDFSSMYQKAANHDFDAMLGGWLAGSGYSDPIQLWGTESWTKKGSNFCGFGNSESDQLIEQANTSLDRASHLEAYRKLQRLIYDEQPYVFLWSGKQPMVAHKRFKNVEFYKARPSVKLNTFILE